MVDLFKTLICRECAGLGGADESVSPHYVPDEPDSGAESVTSPSGRPICDTSQCNDSGTGSSVTILPESDSGAVSDATLVDDPDLVEVSTQLPR